MPHEARKQPTGGIVNHRNQINPLAPALQPVMHAGVLARSVAQAPTYRMTSCGIDNASVSAPVRHNDSGAASTDASPPHDADRLATAPPSSSIAARSPCSPLSGVAGASTPPPASGQIPGTRGRKGPPSLAVPSQPAVSDGTLAHAV